MAYCNEDGCQVLTTGKCVNGLVLDECPHYKEGVNGEEEFEKIDSVEEGGDDLNLEDRHIGEAIDVYSGKALQLSEVNRISSNSISRLIILAGMPDAGKTTLLLSLMHIFQTKSEFAGYIFAGSETLLDFEEKAHPSKAESENLEENTGRTPFGSPTFLHLSVAKKTTGESTDLIFTDISGELFNALKDSTEQCEKFTLAERADQFVILFDSERLTTFKNRANAKTSGIGIIKSLIQAGTLKPHTKIQVIFSRWDLYLKKGRDKIHDEFLEMLKSDLRTQIGEKYNIEFYEVSARPKGKQVAFGHGLEKIFPLWVTESILDYRAPKIQDEETLPLREFLRYQFKN